MIDFKLVTVEFIPSILRMMEEFHSMNHFPFDRKATFSNLSTFVNSPELGRLWLIRYLGITVGYMVLTFGFSFEYQGRDAFVDELYVMEGYRNRGIGNAALEFVHGQAISHNIHAVHLEVEHQNAGARKLYEQQGFTKNGRSLLTRRIFHGWSW